MRWTFPLVVLAGFAPVIAGAQSAAALYGANAVGAHMDHMDMGSHTATSGSPRVVLDDPNLPPSATTAAARLAQSPRHREGVMIPAPGQDTWPRTIAWFRKYLHS
jgi:hypothetical protein